MGEDEVDRWLPFYKPFFPSVADARAFVAHLEALRLGDPDHPAKIMMHQTQRLISLSDDLPNIRKHNDTLRLLFLLICAENIAKLADGFDGAGGSKRYVRNFFDWFLSPEQQRYLCSKMVRHDLTALSLQEVADELYGVRCDVVHEGKYWRQQRKQFAMPSSRQHPFPVPEARLRLFRLRNLCGFLENTMYSRQSGRRPATCFVGITGQVFDL